MDSLLVVNTSNSQVSSSPIPSSAYIRAPENNANEAGGANVFTHNSSPLLIVAFLTTGALTIALAFTFCWRRMRQTQRVVVHAVGRPVRNSTRPFDVRKKPVLWEIWSRNAGGKGDATSCMTKWENIMPFSVERKRPTYPPSKSAPHQATLSTVGHIHWTATQPRLARQPRLSEVEGQAGERFPHTPKGSSLQIAVIIAMPTLTVPQGNPPLLQEGMLEGELVNFCIGVTEAPVEHG